MVDKINVLDAFLEKTSINFYFISKKYSINHRNFDKNKAKAVLKKLIMISEIDYERLVLQNSVETLSPLEIHEKMMAVPSEFLSSRREEKCSENYVVIKGPGIRIIGKINPISRIFYVLAIDTEFELYDHGDHKGNRRL